MSENEGSKHYLAVDVGGTKTLLAVFSDAGELLQEVKFLTSQDYATFLTDFKTHFGELNVQQFAAAGVAIPGVIDHEHGVGVSFGNLPWQNVAVKTDVEAIAGCPVTIENDAKAGGLSEAILIKNDFNKVLYIAIGTGIGISVITNGVIEPSYDKGGNEMMVEHDGQTSDWDDLASGKAIKQRYGKIASDITDENTWLEIADDWAVGIAAMVTAEHPDAIVIGGGAGKPFDRYSEPLKAALAKRLPQVPALLPAQRPDEAVIYGAFELAKQING